MNIIYNPINNKKYNIKSTKGKQLLKSYIKTFLNGGALKPGGLGMQKLMDSTIQMKMKLNL